MNISGFIYMALKSRIYVSKMSMIKKLSILLYSEHWYMYISLRFNGHFPGEPGRVSQCLLMQRMM